MIWKLQLGPRRFLAVLLCQLIYTKQVRASHRGQVATALTRQMNVAAKKAGRNKKLLAILAAVGSGDAIAGGGGGGGTIGGAATPFTPTIRFGGATVGAQ